MKKMLAVLSIAFLLLVVVIAFWRGWLSFNYSGKKDKGDYKKFEYQKIVTKDSVKLETIYILEDSLMSYDLSVKFMEDGLAREAYLEHGIEFSLKLEENHGLLLKKVELKNPVTKLSDTLSLGVMGVKFQDMIPIHPETYNNIEGFSVTVRSEFVTRQFMEQSKSAQKQQ